MRLTNKLNLPAALVRAVERDPYIGGGDITVTKLISPPRLVALSKLHANEITEDVSSRLMALLGQAIHVILERAEVEGVAEERLAIERHGIILSGQFDRLSLLDNTLTDYKVTSTYVARDGGRLEWQHQLNVLAGILREHGYLVEHLEVVVILRDWSKSQAMRNADYPQAAAMKIQIPMWPEEQIEEFISERIRLHQAAKKMLPLCSQEDRWATADSFALMKEGRAKAVRIYTDKSEAYAALEVAGSKHSIEHRPGKSLRCESYCCCSPFCDQWKAMRLSSEAGDAAA